MQRPYLKDRLIEERPEGYVVIIPVSSEPPTPIVCPICDHVMRSREDEHEFSQFGCCDRCSRIWARPRKTAWKDGWRPSAEQVAESELDRVPLLVVFDVNHSE